MEPRAQRTAVVWLSFVLAVALVSWTQGDAVAGTKKKPRGAGPVAPTATSGSASQISASAATLSGSVNPSGSVTSYSFQYGRSTAYGSATPVASAGSGSRTSAVSAVVSGLAAGTAYHFRLVATSAGGTSYGSDAVFTTPASPLSSPSVFWSAGVETGDLSEWSYPGGVNYGGGEYNSDGGSSSASTDVAHSGFRSAKLVLDDGAGGTRLIRWLEPREHHEAYYSAWFYFPQRYTVTGTWWGIFQFKSRTATQNDPFWSLYVGNRADGAMYVYLRDWQHKASYGQSSVNLPVGRWVHLEAFLAQSSEGAGRITVWQDGVELWDLGGISTNYAGGENHWGLTNYTDGVGGAPVTIYVDDAAVSAARLGA
jgi:hypothetical protein